MDLDAEIEESAARLRTVCRLKLADAVQAATALAIGAGALVTHDRAFSALGELRVLGVESKDSPREEGADPPHHDEHTRARNWKRPRQP
ncbi:MAG TPA: PIN domain-containing protein [Acidobacteriaceae bacterium]|nr:PIN domain-containing protein [Acidobacteriaceae bacterium]